MTRTRRPRTKQWTLIPEDAIARMTYPRNLVMGVKEITETGPDLGVIGVYVGNTTAPADSVYELHHSSRAERRAQETAERRAWKRAGKEAKIVSDLVSVGLGEDTAQHMADAAIEDWKRGMSATQRRAYESGGKLRGRGYTK